MPHQSAGATQRDALMAQKSKKKKKKEMTCFRISLENDWKCRINKSRNPFI